MQGSLPLFLLMLSTHSAGSQHTIRIAVFGSLRAGLVAL